MPQLREGWCDRNTEETCLAYESNINNMHTAYQFEPVDRRRSVQDMSSSDILQPR